MTEKTELKPCPFCGGKARYYYERGNDSIVCEECGAKLTYLDFGDAHDELVKQWNSRPIEDKFEEENERYLFALEMIRVLYEQRHKKSRLDKTLYEVARDALEWKDDENDDE